MIELFVEKQQVDINVGFATLLTMAIDDIKDFGAKNTTFSKSIILPGTKRNNVLFGNLFDVSGSNDYNPLLDNKGINFNAAVSAQAYIFADNIQIFKGTFRILEVIIDDGKIEYEAVVFGELGGFVAKLGNLKLEDLDFSAYDHTYNITNIIASRSALGSGYIYPNNIDYGTYSPAKKHWQYGTMRPALFVKEYVDKIFEASGYTYDCDLFSGSTPAALRYKGLIVPHNRKELTKYTNVALNVSAIPGNTYTVPDDGVGINIPLPIQQTLGSFTPNGTNTIFTYTGVPINGKFKITIDFDYINTSPYVGLLYFNKDNVYPSFPSWTYFGSAASYTNAQTYSEFDLTITSGDTVFIPAALLGTHTSGTSATVKINSVNITFINSITQSVAIGLGGSVVMNDVLPQNIVQKDFISSIVKLYNLYIFEDRDKDKTLKIMPFVDFYTDAESEDLSLKIDRSSVQRVKPMSELNARYYDFKFKKDADYYNDLYSKRYNEDYGTYKYDSQYEFANETSTIELIFSGTPLVGYSGEDKVYSTIFKRTGDVTGTGEEKIDSNIRILQTKLITGVASWDIMDGATVLGSYTNYLYAGHLDDPDVPTNDIQFGVPKELFFTLVTGALNVNQFNVYWSSYMAEITDKDSKLLTATVKLNFSDIYNLDFSKLKWIDGSLFRLNKVIDFDATNENTCKVELLKVINKIY